MKKYQRRGRGVHFAVIALTVLSFPTVSVAQADQPTEQPQVAKKNPKKYAATTRQRQTDTRRNLYGWDRRSAFGCAWPYQNQFPPCMSTWPAGSPSYHGPRPGPTFFDEQ